MLPVLLPNSNFAHEPNATALKQRTWNESSGSVLYSWFCRSPLWTMVWIQEVMSYVAGQGLPGNFAVKTSNTWLQWKKWFICSTMPAVGQTKKRMLGFHLALPTGPMTIGYIGERAEYFFLPFFTASFCALRTSWVAFIICFGSLNIWTVKQHPISFVVFEYIKCSLLAPYFHLSGQGSKLSHLEGCKTVHPLCLFQPWIKMGGLCQERHQA